MFNCTHRRVCNPSRHYLQHCRGSTPVSLGSLFSYTRQCVCFRRVITAAPSRFYVRQPWQELVFNYYTNFYFGQFFSDTTKLDMTVFWKPNLGVSDGSMLISFQLELLRREEWNHKSETTRSSAKKRQLIRLRLNYFKILFRFETEDVSFRFVSFRFVSFRYHASPLFRVPGRGDHRHRRALDGFRPQHRLRQGSSASCDVKV